jgi:hypothetical protein
VSTATPAPSKRKSLVRRWRLGLRWWRRHLRVPPWIVIGTAAIGLGIWGFTLVASAPGSKPIHHLDVIQSFISAVDLFGLGLGPAAGIGEHVPWQVIVAILLAGSLTVRALLALTGSRIRRWYIRNRLRGHLVVCGAGSLGTALATALGRTEDVVLIDLDPHAAGLAPDPARLDWTLQGDATLPDTLRAAGVEHAAELIAVTADEYVNAQIVTAATSAGARARILIRLEEPGLLRFFEERVDEDRSLQVSPFSAHVVVARALLVDETPIPEWHDDGRPLLSLRDGRAPHVLLAGDHALLDALILEGLRRWRALALETPDGVPPLRISVYGADAVARVERLRNRFAPEPELVEIYSRDAPSGGEGAIETDDWLRRLRTAGGNLVSHALVACGGELDGVSMALAVGRALGESVPLLRVSIGGSGALDERIHEQTRRSRHRATTTATSLPELACRADAIRRHAAPEQRLLDELLRRGAAADVARRAVERVMSIPELEVHSEPAWRFSAHEVPLLRALLDDEGAPLESFVAAGLALDVSAPDVLRRCAVRLYEPPRDGDPLLASAWRARLAPAELSAAAFAAVCEFARAARDPADLESLRAQLHALAADTATGERMLALREQVLREGPPGDLDGAQPEPLRGFERVAIFAGAAASAALTEDALHTLSWLLGPPQVRRRRSASQPGEGHYGHRDEHDSLLSAEDRFQALRDFDGVVLSGGTGVGVPGVVAAAANGYGVPLIGYVPQGAGDRALYAHLRETPGSDFSELEPLMMWTDILAAGLAPAQVSLVASPGGAITRAEILIARALGALVAWLDPEGEAPIALDDDLPGGAEKIIELPPDAMCVRAVISRTKLEDPQLRDHVAKLTHAQYRSQQPPERLERDPACAPWDRLLPVFRASNRAQADDIPNKLAMLGLRVERLDAGGRPLRLTERQIQQLAEMEHGRYVFDRLQAGWRHGDRDANRGRSPYFVPWSELTEAERYWDLSAVETIAGALQSFGYGVTELERKTQPAARRRVSR